MQSSRTFAAFLLALGGLPASAFGEDALNGGERVSAEAQVEGAGPKEKISLFSLDEVDPTGLSRLHLVTRATFSDGERVFGGVSAWSFEARAHVRVSPGLALTGTLPVGFISQSENSPSKAFLGNLTLGIAGGGTVLGGEGPQLRVGGAFETGLPTSAQGKTLQQEIAQSVVSAIRAYDPQLYVPKMLSFRARAHAEVVIQRFSIAAEAGLVPAVSFLEDKTFQLLFAASGRVSALCTPGLEAYLEVSGSKQIAGVGAIVPPVLITPGIRLHLFETFDPAVFASLNTVQSGAVIFGLDLASAVRPTARDERAERKEKRRGESTDDFLNGP